MSSFRVYYGVVVVFLVAPPVNCQTEVTCNGHKQWFQEKAEPALKMAHQILQVLVESSPPSCDCAKASICPPVAPCPTVAPVAPFPPVPPPCPPVAPALNPTSCTDLQISGVTASGVYKIWAKPWFRLEPFDVYCDMGTSGGGWTVIQRRDTYEEQENFTRSWSEYAAGFGDVNREYWLGNDRISALTNQECVNLRFDMADFEGQSRYAEYTSAVVSDEQQSYKLTFGAYIGDAGDAMATHKDRTFSTFDRGVSAHCSVTYKGGWWYNNCHTANPNGLYLKGKHETFADGVDWKEWLGYNYSLRKMEIKVRPCRYKGLL